MLQGSVTSGTCENTGSWSGRLPSCVLPYCVDRTEMLPSGATIVASPSCRSEYQSRCTVSCDEGFTGDNVTYLCDVTSDPTMVDWVPVLCYGYQCYVLWVPVPVPVWVPVLWVPVTGYHWIQVLCVCYFNSSMSNPDKWNLSLSKQSSYWNVW